MAVVLNHSKATGAAKIIMIGIANHDGDGGAWPSLGTLARYANVSPRNARAAVARLEQLGEVRRIIQQGGDHTTEFYNRPNLYRILLECPANCDRSRNHRMTGETRPEPLDLDPRMPATGEDASDRGAPDASDLLTIPLTRTTKDPAQPQYTRTRNTERSARSPRPASASAALAHCGHPIVATSGGGVPFCSLGCAPTENPIERQSA